MKNILAIILLTCLISTTLAQEPQSMRYLASSGVFTDTWEDVYDPISLNNIERFYFFTNFADFSYSFNDNFGQLSENSETRLFEEFPFGIAFTNPFKENIKHAFFVRFRNSLTPELTENGNMGEYEESNTLYGDSNNDGIIDEKSITYTKEENYQDNDKLVDFIWNNNIEMDNYSLGFKISLFNYKEELDNAQERMGLFNFGGYDYLDGFNSGSNQLDTYGELYDIDEDDYKHRYSEKGNFSTKLEEKKMNFMFSLEKNSNLFVDDNNLRFDLAFNIVKSLSRDTNDSYYGSYEDIIVPDTLVNYGMITDDYKRKINMSTKKISFVSSMNKEIDSRFNGEYGFWEIGFSTGYLQGEKENSWKKHLISAEKVDSLNSTEYTITELQNNYSLSDENGDISAFDFSSYFLMNLPLNKTANFGYGLTYNYTYSIGEFDLEEKLENVEENYMGQEIDTSSEYQITETQYFSGEKETIITNNEFVIPIALEFKIPTNHISSNDGFGIRNFLFRLGSTFIYDFITTENTYNSIDNQINFRIIEYGDGSVEEDHIAFNELSSNKEIITQATSSKIFTGGIGYEHSENVNIDLGGKYNYQTEDYFIGLSFTISK